MYYGDIMLVPLWGALTWYIPNWRNIVTSNVSTMNDEALRIHSFKANSKVFQQKFTLSQAACADANPKGTLFKECHCLFMSSKEAFRSYLMIFKCKDLWCALYRWSCGLISKKTGNRLTHFVIHHCEKHWYCKLFWKELSTHKSIKSHCSWFILFQPCSQGSLLPIHTEWEG